MENELDFAKMLMESDASSNEPEIPGYTTGSIKDLDNFNEAPVQQTKEKKKLPKKKEPVELVIEEDEVEFNSNPPEQEKTEEKEKEIPHQNKDNNKAAREDASVVEEKKSPTVPETDSTNEQSFPGPHEMPEDPEINLTIDIDKLNKAGGNISRMFSQTPENSFERVTQERHFTTEEKQDPEPVMQIKKRERKMNGKLVRITDAELEQLQHPKVIEKVVVDSEVSAALKLKTNEVTEAKAALEAEQQELERKRTEIRKKAYEKLEEERDQIKKERSEIEEAKKKISSEREQLLKNIAELKAKALEDDDYSEYVTALLTNENGEEIPYPRLVSVKTGREVKINRAVYTIGSLKSNSLVISEEEGRHTVSRRHAKIYMRTDGIYIVDESTNGTSLGKDKEKPEEFSRLLKGNEYKLQDRTYISFAKELYLFLL